MSSSKDMEKLQVNKKLLPIKVHYFLYNGAFAGVIPFISVYGKQLGISADVMGILFAVISSVTVISRPLLGGLADHFQKLKLVLVSLVLIDITLDVGMNFIPQPPTTAANSTNSSLFCHQNVPHLIQFQTENCHLNASICDGTCLPSCYPCDPGNTTCGDSKPSSPRQDASASRAQFPVNISSSCMVQLIKECNEGTLVDCNMWLEDYTHGGNNSKENALLQLCLLSVFTIIMYICKGSIVSLSDAACFNSLGSESQLYGKQRMWRTIGWGSFAFLAGFLNQVASGTSTVYNFSAGFYMSAALFVIDLLVISKLELEDAKRSKNILRVVGRLLLRPRIILFLLQVFCVGIFRGMASYYVFWYLRTLNASQLVIGCTSAVLCFLGELPFFFFSGWIIKKIGHMNTFVLSFVSYGCKFLSYSFIENPWWSLLIEILQGPCYGSLYAAMTSYAKLISPVGTEATVQGIASGTLEGLGVAAGCLLGGYGFQNFGGRQTFFWTGIISFVLGMINCIINCVLACRKTSPEEVSESNQSLIAQKI